MLCGWLGVHIGLSPFGPKLEAGQNESLFIKSWPVRGQMLRGLLFGCLGRLLQVAGQRSVFMYGLANVHLYIHLSGRHEDLISPLPPSASPQTGLRIPGRCLGAYVNRFGDGKLLEKGLASV